MNNDKVLKRKITERWNVITDHQTFNPMPDSRRTTALAQLEYILIEAGLLAPRRERPSERAMRTAATTFHMPQRQQGKPHPITTNPPEGEQ